jgi:hypothetical protein
MVKSYVVNYSGYRIPFTVEVSVIPDTVHQQVTFRASGEIPSSPIDADGNLTHEGRARQVLLASDPSGGGGAPLPLAGDIDPEVRIREILAEAFAGATIE